MSGIGKWFALFFRGGDWGKAGLSAQKNRREFNASIGKRPGKTDRSSLLNDKKSLFMGGTIIEVALCVKEKPSQYMVGLSNIMKEIKLRIQCAQVCPVSTLKFLTRLSCYICFINCLTIFTPQP